MNDKGTQFHRNRFDDARRIRFIDPLVLTSAFHVPINNSPRMKNSASPRCARSSCWTPSPTKPSTQ